MSMRASRRAPEDGAILVYACLVSAILVAAALASVLLLARAGAAKAAEATPLTTAFVDVWVSGTLARRLDAQRHLVAARRPSGVEAAVAAELAATLPGRFPADRLDRAFAHERDRRTRAEAGPITASRILPAIAIRRLGHDRIRIVVSTLDGEVARTAAEFAIGPTLSAISAKDGALPAPRLVLSAIAARGPAPGEAFAAGLGAVCLLAALMFAAGRVRRGVAVPRQRPRSAASTGGA